MKMMMILIISLLEVIKKILSLIGISNILLCSGSGALILILKKRELQNKNSQVTDIWYSVFT